MRGSKLEITNLFIQRNLQTVHTFQHRNVLYPRFGSANPLAPLPQDVLEILDREPDDVSTLTDERRLSLLSEVESFQQILDVPLNNDPPKRPVGYDNHRLIVFPEDYQSQAIQHVTAAQALKVPTKQQIKDITADSPLDFTVPIQKAEAFSVAENTKAFMDLQKDAQARLLVSSGLQPSMIGKNWKAVWGLEKTTRDILQNFFDGHNGTLEGTKIQVRRDTATGKYKVLITGLGQYDYEKAYLLGGTSKSKDKSKAGNYGEGLKVLSLNLLRDFGADAVRMASANWQMTYTMPEEQGGEPKMFRHLEELETPQSGNYLEFTTTSTELVEQLFKSLNYFYHPYNPDFTGTVISTPFGGIAVSANPSTQNGNVYIARQRFAYETEDNWEGPLEGASVWTNEKSIEKGRDRTAVHKSELDKAMANIVKGLSDNDLVYALKALEEQWDAADKTTINTIVALIVKQMLDRKLTTTFDEKYYAGNKNRISYNVTSNLGSMGYKFCPEQFVYIGMTPLEDWHKYFANFKMIEPSPGEKQRIQILHKLMQDFVVELKDTSYKPFDTEDIVKPIYVFDQGDQSGPDKLVQGRARYNAIWMGNRVLRSPLYEVFNIYAHELMHKHGDDGSHAFSNIYDKYIPMMTEMMSTSPRFNKLFQECEVLWKESIEREAPFKPETATPSTPQNITSAADIPASDLSDNRILKYLTPASKRLEIMQEFKEHPLLQKLMSSIGVLADE